MFKYIAESVASSLNTVIDDILNFFLFMIIPTLFTVYAILRD